jgi:hypothetical protein
MTNQKKQLIIFFSGLVLFLVVLGLSIVLQSAVLLYIASAIPMLVVPYLPDLRTNQVLKARRGVEVVRVGENNPDSEMLIVSFKPGDIYWNKRYLYISLNDMVSDSQSDLGPFTLSMTVLRHDLHFQPKKNRIGVYLPNLLERLKDMPISPNEVNRLTLRMEDVRDAIMPEPMRMSSTGQINIPM